jgi:spermidine synthase
VLIPLYAVTLFLASALLFAMEPMVARALLPVLGGGGAVWVTAVAFFQLALLAGYLYAHFGPRWLGERRHALAHVVLFAVVAVTLPLAAPLGWTAPPGHQALWLFGRLAVTVGPPFILLAATAPLAQRWFTSTDHPRAADPYFLYVASNVGSMLALLCYPFLIEPLVGLARQRRVWNGSLLIAVGLLGACVAWARRHARRTATLPLTAAVLDPAPSWRTRLGWLALSAVPASLLLSVTTFLTTDLVALPLLWIVPLAIYLLTFIIAFSPRVPWSSRGAARVQLFLLLPVVAELFAGSVGSGWVLLVIHVLAFFVTALVCHQRLVESRPTGARATEFYLWIAAGGALGGLFNVFAAPVLFDGTSEYLLGLVAAALLRPAAEGGDARDRRNDLLLPFGLAVVLLVGTWVQYRALLRFGGTAGLIVMSVLLSAGAVFAVVARARPLRFGLAIGALVAAAVFHGQLGSSVIYAARSFYGIHRVMDDPPGTHRLVHGSTVHGIQNLAADRRREPMAYYHRLGPLGGLMNTWRDRPELTRVGVAGLGVGTLAAFQPAGAHWTFFEIDPTVLDIARDRGLFTYLADARGTIDYVLGDGRLTIAAVADGSFGMLILDAFSSDAVPTHLLTREAMTLYLSKLAPHGLLIFNVSNRFIALEPVIGATAAGLRLVARACLDIATAAETRLGKTSSHWMVVAREPADLAPLASDARWRPAARGEAWTDDASNVWRAFRFHLH